MEFWIVIEEDYGEVYVHPFNCLEMARNYVDEYCTGIVRIEHHIMNLGWHGKEQLSNDQAKGGSDKTKNR